MVDLNRRFMVLAACAVAACSVEAQTSSSLHLSLEDARQRLLGVSDALAAADANVRGKQTLSEATGHLRLPDISLDAGYLQFQKTLELPLGSLAPVAQAYGIPSPLRFEERDWRFRPMLTAVLPLYTGGKIPAAQDAAAAAARQASAERNQQADTISTQLVQAYFGEQLATQALAVRKDVRDGLNGHLANAEKLEREGFATKAQRLQATVARDSAEREYQKASNDRDTATITLAQLLRSQSPVHATTPLFVIQAPMDARQGYVDSALANHPQIARLKAMGEQAAQGVRVAQAELKPQIFLFGSYDLHRRDALLFDPDWVFGIGLKYTFLSGRDRPRQISAARDQQEQAEAGLREAENQLVIGVTRAWNEVETQRQQYLLLESSIAQAKENLRLQQLSFREGRATSLDVIDAQMALGGAQLERLQAAYTYDVALA
jgi:outer membrane protein TolC